MGGGTARHGVSRKESWSHLTALRAQDTRRGDLKGMYGRGDGKNNGRSTFWLVLPKANTSPQRLAGRLWLSGHTPEVAHFCWEHPSLGIKLVLFRGLMVHSGHEHCQTRLRNNVVVVFYVGR